MFFSKLSKETVADIFKESVLFFVPVCFESYGEESDFISCKMEAVFTKRIADCMNGSQIRLPVEQLLLKLS